jgi:tRNA (mo5U34)-methyltransferase
MPYPQPKLERIMVFLGDSVSGESNRPWFHNLRLDGEETAPNHPLGDFPANFFAHFAHVIPNDLSGWTVLDIGCNGGFYSFEMKRRGAERVLGVDHDPVYLAQARYAGDRLGLDVEFRHLDVYDIDLVGEKFDLVLFLGVLYHLRYPLYALEKVAGVVRRRLVFQTMERGSSEIRRFEPDYPIGETAMFEDERYPRLYFVEASYAGDPTNWFIPNAAASQAMLRSCGLEVLEKPCGEVYLCQPSSHSDD